MVKFQGKIVATVTDNAVIEPAEDWKHIKDAVQAEIEEWFEKRGGRRDDDE